MSEIEKERSYMPEPGGSLLCRQHEGRTDWSDVHRRLESSRAALQRRMTPDLEERQRILHERAQLLARERQAEERPVHATLEIVEFLLASEHYGIESMYIREVHPLNDLTFLPCAPPFVLGLTNVRGQIISVIDIKRLFGLPERGLTDLNKLIVVRSDEMELGILADAIVGVRSLALSEMQTSLPTLTGIRAEYLKGLTRDPVAVLNIDKILSDEKIVVDEGGNGAK